MPAESEHLVEDLFEKITMFRNEVAAATFTERADGTFLVRVELEAHKRRATEPAPNGRSRSTIGSTSRSSARERMVRAAAPRPFLERRRIRASPVAFEIVVDQRPAWVAIDPYYKLIDRDRGDNVRAVLSAGAQAGR